MLSTVYMLCHASTVVPGSSFVFDALGDDAKLFFVPDSQTHIDLVNKIVLLSAGMVINVCFKTQEV